MTTTAVNVPSRIRDLILQAQDRPLEKVNVPEWGTDVYIRVMSGTERDAYERVAYDPEAEQTAPNWKCQLLVRCLCDEQGQRIFTDDNSEALNQKSGAVIDRLDDIARRLNGIGAKAVEAIAGN